MLSLSQPNVNDSLRRMWSPEQLRICPHYAPEPLGPPHPEDSDIFCKPAQQVSNQGPVQFLLHVISIIHLGLQQEHRKETVNTHGMFTCPSTEA